MKRIATLFILFVSVYASGCGSIEISDAIVKDIGEYINNLSSFTENDKSNINTDVTEDTDPLEGIVIPDGYVAVVTDGTAFVGKTDKTRYYRSQLSEAEQKVYDEIYVIVDNMLGETNLSAYDSETLELAARAVMYDFPEFFYLTNYEYIQYMIEDKLNRITFIGHYSASQEERKSCLAYIDDYYNVFASGISEDMGDYEIAKYLYEFIAYNTEYVSGSMENQNILSAMLYGKSVCSGYAKTYQYIMNRLGYEAILVSGESVKTGESHAWDIVKLDGEYYYVDPTWGDNPVEGLDIETDTESETDFDNKYDEVSPVTVNYGYLCIPEKWILRTHTFDNFLPLPECNSVDDNYYVKNGVYIDICEPKVFDDIIKYYTDRGLNVVTFRCSSYEVLHYWRRYLFDEQHIFDYLPGDNTAVSYVMDEDAYVITLLLS